MPGNSKLTGRDAGIPLAAPHEDRAGEEIGAAAGRQVSLDEVTMQSLCSFQPRRLRTPTFGQEGRSRSTDERTAVEAAAIEHGGVVDRRHQGEQRLDIGGVRVEAGPQGLAIGRDPHLEHAGESECRFLPGAVMPGLVAGQRAVTRRCRAAGGMGLERCAPFALQRRANEVWRHRRRECLCPGDGRNDETDREDRAAMCVDPTGGGQHAALGIDTEGNQRVLERAARAACGGKSCEWLQQCVRGPAHEREVHVGMGARIDRAHQSGLGIGLQFLAYRGDGGVRQ